MLVSGNHSPLVQLAYIYCAIKYDNTLVEKHEALLQIKKEKEGLSVPLPSFRYMYLSI